MEPIRLTITKVDTDSSVWDPKTRRTLQVEPLRIFLSGGHWFRLVPPRRVLNEFFRLGATGGEEEGCSVIYEWEPFELNEHEYAKLLDEIRKIPGNPFEEDFTLPEE